MKKLLKILWQTIKSPLISLLLFTRYPMRFSCNFLIFWGSVIAQRILDAYGYLYICLDYAKRFDFQMNTCIWVSLYQCKFHILYKGWILRKCCSSMIFRCINAYGYLCICVNFLLCMQKSLIFEEGLQLKFFLDA